MMNPTRFAKHVFSIMQEFPNFKLLDREGFCFGVSGKGEHFLNFEFIDFADDKHTGRFKVIVETSLENLMFESTDMRVSKGPYVEDIKDLNHTMTTLNNIVTIYFEIYNKVIMDVSAENFNAFLNKNCKQLEFNEYLIPASKALSNIASASTYSNKEIRINMFININDIDLFNSFKKFIIGG